MVSVKQESIHITPSVFLLSSSLPSRSPLRPAINGVCQIRFLADPHASLTTALDLAFDGTAIFGQPRSKRYALVIEDGKVVEAHVEGDNTGVNGKCASFLTLSLRRKLLI